ncbi:MAG TPA: ATP-grasp domain-containing protein [Planctomycetota bacterium]|nr:ATP-grasp domain-containing protein [Planctomycetota bacterium]
MRKLRVLVLCHETALPPDSIDGLDEDDLELFRAEWDVLAALRGLGHDARAIGVGDELAPVREALTEFQPHVVFNLLVHFYDVGAYDAHVVTWLELQRQPYTGCNPRGLMLANDKALSKKILAYHRVPVPGFATFRAGSKPRKPARLAYPLFVKSAVEGASLGISQASIVHDDEQLAERVAYVQREIGPLVIAEEYIRGRELTIGLVGNERPQVLPLWELFFGELAPGVEPIATSRVKWDHEYQRKIGLRAGPAAPLPDGVAESIVRLAKRIYRALELSGYARIDLRVTEDGRVYVLEANPNPDLSASEDFAASAAAAGLPLPQLVQRILNLGLGHHAPWKG